MKALKTCGPDDAAQASPRANAGKRRGIEALSNREWRPSSLHGIAVVLLLAGCATPYQSLGARGGYSDYRISADVFAVNFRGNTATREETVEKYLLRRASELTLEHGFKHFVVLSEKGRTRSSSLGYSGFKVPVIAPGGAIQIRCFHSKPADSDSPIDAANFLRFNFPEALNKPPIEAEAATP